MAGEFDGVYHNVPTGFVYLWEKAGWKALPHVYNGTHHGFYGMMMKWEGQGEPVFPTIEAA